MQSIKIDNRLRFSYKIRSEFKELKTLLKQQQYIIVQWIYLRINYLHSCYYGRGIVPAPPQKMTRPATNLKGVKQRHVSKQELSEET